MRLVLEACYASRPVMPRGLLCLEASQLVLEASQLVLEASDATNAAYATPAGSNTPHLLRPPHTSRSYIEDRSGRP
jgi:hypothetical protein